MKNRANDKNKQRSLWVEAWRRLRKNKLAMNIYNRHIFLVEKHNIISLISKEFISFKKL